MQRACELVQGSSNPNNVVIFLSDGFGTGNALDDLPCRPQGATFQTFAVGNGSSCSSTLGTSLGEIADATGGSCTHVTDVSTLPDVIPGVIDARLERLLLRIDGGLPIEITGDAKPALAQTGPATVGYARAVSDLAPGTHELCVTAVGSDAGGSGSVVECTSVVITAPRVWIDDVTVVEGDAGTVPATFTATLSEPSSHAITVRFATADGSATAPADYAAATGSASFAPGATSAPVTVLVHGDEIDEPDETFTVSLSPQSGPVIIADGEGVGTIVDDERDGAFSCRASALRIGGLLEPVVANRPGAPCRDDAATSVSRSLTAPSGIVATVGAPNARTDQTPDDLQAAAPAAGDSANARADTADATIATGIRATATQAEARAVCTSAAGPELSSSSRVAGLVVNGQSYGVVTQPTTIGLLAGTLKLNHEIRTPTQVVRRAIWLDANLGADVIIGEAIADFSGNPCDA